MSNGIPGWAGAYVLWHSPTWLLPLERGPVFKTSTPPDQRRRRLKNTSSGVEILRLGSLENHSECKKTVGRQIRVDGKRDVCGCKYVVIKQKCRGACVDRKACGEAHYVSRKATQFRFFEN